jgi:hypothetical protein
MAELSQKDQLALHEFSVRYRAALAKENPTPEASREVVQEAVREQYEQDMDAKHSPDIGRQPPRRNASRSNRSQNIDGKKSDSQHMTVQFQNDLLVEHLALLSPYSTGRVDMIPLGMI